MNNMQFVTSPYLYIYRQDDAVWSIVSYLDEMLFSLDKRDMELLRFCRLPKTATEIKKKHTEDAFESFVNRKLLLNRNEMWKQFCIKYVEIEITSHCNFRCRYCPNHYHAKKPSYMVLELYNNIIDQLAEMESVEYVTLHGYNEPLLDCFFKDRINKLAEKELKLVLFTNASLLNDDIVAILKKSGVLKLLKVNFPTLDRKRFQHLTDSAQFELVKANIENAIQKQLPIEIICNGTNMDYAELKRYFADIEVKQHNTNDRAGILKNEYAMHYYYGKRLNGCSQVTDWAHIGVNGEVYLCYMDYYKKYNLGNLQASPLQDILAGETAENFRKTVFGFLPSGTKWICRRCFQNYISRVLARNSKFFRSETGE